jgi:UDP-N-acetylglucosamine:LPS N-acetylglucosamine transferase
MMPEKKILILTSDTGGGHTSAARAIEAGLNLFAHPLSYLIHISRVIEESHFVARQTVWLYNFLLRHYQSYVKYYHWSINKVGLERSELLYRFYRKYVAQLVNRYCPNMIISVHPMVQHGVARILGDLNLLNHIPLVTVVTDPCGNSWKGWANEHVRLYIVAHDEARQELINYGIDPDRIRICGMPIHPKFQQAAETLSPEEMRKELGLDPNKFTVFINAGWIGGGNIPKIFKQLSRSNLDMQGIFLAGKNTKLMREATKIAATSNFPVRVVGYSEKMERLMSAANVMVSKLGGLTTFEALACRLPIIMDHLTPPMPQEAGTTDLIERSNAGVRLKNAADIVPILRQLIEDKSHYLAMRAAAQALSIPDATRRIVNELTPILNKETRPR